MNNAATQASPSPAAIGTKLLFTMHAELQPSLDGGEGSLGRRVLNAVAQGRFEGPNMRGEILPGTGDWMLIRRDGSMVIDARVTLKTDDGALIHMSYGGRIHVPAELLADVRNPDKRHLIDPSLYYFRSNPVFETGAPNYLWLNNIVSIGSGRLGQGRSVAYDIFQVL
jgi:hypothetical protein